MVFDKLMQHNAESLLRALRSGSVRVDVGIQPTDGARCERNSAPRSAAMNIDVMVT